MTRARWVELALGLGGGVLAGALVLHATPLAAAPGAAAAVVAPPAVASGETHLANRTPAQAAPPAQIGPAYDGDEGLATHAEEVVAYSLEARLDADLHVITGKGTITWRNTSDRPTSELWLHLYLNAFKNDRTLFLRSPFGAGRSGDHAAAYGYCDVKRLHARELDLELWPRAELGTGGDPGDETDVRVPLPGPVGAGKSLTLDVEWTSALPAIVERTGWSSSFHLVAQWFPKLARLESDGTWVHFPFHPQAEFYADFGRYDVTLDVPEGFVVAATGPRTEERRDGGRRIVRHVANDVHDFVFAAWDQFQVASERIDDVDVTVFTPPGYEDASARTLATLRRALPHYSRAYGRYPYPVLSVVHPPEAARNAGGMEYPTLITTGGLWFGGQAIRDVETVTVHELGHQWFYGLVASDEHAFPFLDEGVNTWAEQRALGELYGTASAGRWLDLEVSSGALRRGLSALRGGDEVVAAPAAAFATFGSLGALVYARTGAILDTLGAVYGREALQRAIGRYARYYRFLHPGPRHFIAAVRGELGDEAAEVLSRALFERGTVNFQVRDVSSVEERAPRGVFDKPGGRETVLVDPPPSGLWVSRALVYRLGSLRLPVDIELELADGRRQRRSWDGRGDFTTVEWAASSPLVRATVDPDRKIALDSNPLDNAGARRSAEAPRAAERALYVAELLLGLVGP